MTKWLSIIEKLQTTGQTFGPGLSDSEVAQTERRFDFRFPPDLRSFLQTGLPTGAHFPHWRSGEETELRKRLSWPLDGALFDVQHNQFWLSEWGERPGDLSDALELAAARIQEAPKLIPVWGHRYMPEEPHQAGNPVFSVYQTDIIYYGFDLKDYLLHEFNLPGRKDWPTTTRQIHFWDPVRFENAGRSNSDRP